MTDFVDQGYLDSKAEELKTYADAVESRLQSHAEGEVDEEHVKRPARLAVEVYEELGETLDEVREQIQQHDEVDEFEGLLEEHGYSSGAEFLAGQTPPTAGNEHPATQLMEELGENNWPDTGNAYDAKKRYNEVRKKAQGEHGIELPHPDIDNNPEHREIIELAEEEGIPITEARKEVKGEDPELWRIE